MQCRSLTPTTRWFSSSTRPIRLRSIYMAGKIDSSEALHNKQQQVPEISPAAWTSPQARSAHLIVPATICCVGCPSRASPTHCESGPYTPSPFLASTSSSCSNAVPTYWEKQSTEKAKQREQGTYTRGTIAECTYRTKPSWFHFVTHTYMYMVLAGPPRNALYVAISAYTTAVWPKTHVSILVTKHAARFHNMPGQMLLHR